MRANSRSGAALPLLAPLFWSVVVRLFPVPMRKVVGKRSSPLAVVARGRTATPTSPPQPSRSAPPSLRLGD
jgi:hypothetical protein